MESTRPKPFCFVLMPFDSIFDDIYHKGIKKACNNIGAYCERVDEQNYDGTILSRIYNQISKADIIIADMTGKNPNVFYEVGYAHALGKPTVLLTQKSEDIPFDLKSYPHIIYNNSIPKLLKELPNKIKWFIENNLRQPEQYKLDIDLYLGENSLTEKGVVCNLNQEQYSNGINLSLINTSSKTYTSDDFSLGCFMLNPSIILKHNGTNLDSSTMPSQEVFYYIPLTRKLLFPQMPLSINLSFVFRYDGINESEMVFRLFSNAVTRDYYLKIRKNIHSAATFFG